MLFRVEHYMGIFVFKCYFCFNSQKCVLFDSEKDLFVVEAIERRKKPQSVTC